MLSILHLVLYSDTDPVYVAMRAQTMQWYRATAEDPDQQVLTLYYCWNPLLPKGAYRYQEQEMLLELGGEETFLPGILAKTMQTFCLLSGTLDLTQVDYVVRSNVSSVIDFRVLCRYLEEGPVVHYGCSRRNHIDYQDAKYGLTDDRYAGLTYGTGCCLLFSLEAFQWLCQPEALARIDYSVIDDVALGALLTEKYGPVQRIPYPRSHLVVPSHATQSSLAKSVRSQQVAVYRNQNGPQQRQTDLQHIEWIVRALLQNDIKQTDAETKGIEHVGATG